MGINKNWFFIFFISLLFISSCGGALPPPDPYNLANAKDSLKRGNYWHFRGCHEEAENFYFEALYSARLSDAVPLIAQAQNAIGLSALSRNDFDMAAEYLEQALMTSNAQKDQPELDDILGNLGLLSFSLKRFDDAEYFWKEAIEKSAVANKNPSKYWCNLGRLYLSSKNESSLSEAASQCFTYASKSKDEEELADAYSLMGIIAMKNNDLDQAEINFTKALSFDRKNENTVGLAKELATLGKLRVETNDYQQAASNFDRAFFLFLALGDASGYKNVFTEIKNLNRNNNIPKSIKVYEKALEKPENYLYTKSQCP